jgi:hypothetical protein
MSSKHNKVEEFYLFTEAKTIKNLSSSKEISEAPTIKNVSSSEGFLCFYYWRKPSTSNTFCIWIFGFFSREIFSNFIVGGLDFIRNFIKKVRSDIIFSTISMKRKRRNPNHFFTSSMFFDKIEILSIKITLSHFVYYIIGHMGKTLLKTEQHK